MARGQPQGRTFSSLSSILFSHFSSLFSLFLLHCPPHHTSCKKAGQSSPRPTASTHRAHLTALLKKQLLPSSPHLLLHTDLTITLSSLSFLFSFIPTCHTPPVRIAPPAFSNQRTPFGRHSFPFCDTNPPHHGSCCALQEEAEGSYRRWGGEANKTVQQNTNCPEVKTRKALSLQ